MSFEEIIIILYDVKCLLSLYIMGRACIGLEEKLKRDDVNRILMNAFRINKDELKK